LENGVKLLKMSIANLEYVISRNQLVGWSGDDGDLMSREDLDGYRAQLKGIEKEQQRRREIKEKGAACPNCFKGLSPEYAVCPYCGHQLKPDLPCRRCGKPLKVEFAVCPYCGETK
jgi:predicted amidophosphoribosyltransferase